MSNEQGGRQTLETRKAQILATIARLNVLIDRRNLSLRDKEILVLTRVAKREISFLNPGARKGRMVYVIMSAATHELECKINRRGLFYLRMRKRAMEREVASIEAQLLDAPESDAAAA